MRVGHAHGYRMVEFDVKLSADNVAFLLHDATLERTTSGRGRADALPWRELSRLDAGGWHSAQVRGRAAADARGDRALGARARRRAATSRSSRRPAASARPARPSRSTPRRCGATPTCRRCCRRSPRTSLDAARDAVPRAAARAAARRAAADWLERLRAARLRRARRRSRSCSPPTSCDAAHRGGYRVLLLHAERSGARRGARGLGRRHDHHRRHRPDRRDSLPPAPPLHG